MTKELSSDQQDRIMQLLDEGELTQKQIAEDVGLGKWGYKTVARYAKKLREQKEEGAKETKSSRMLDEMSRDERFDHLKTVFEHTPRARFVFQSLGKSEKEFFIDEYLRIIKSTDSITEAEEQQLFSACIEYVLAYRALKMKSMEEEMYEETMDGVHEKGDERYRREVNDRFGKEYDTHMKSYQKFMQGLKLSREQRLDKIKSDKRTLADLAAELADRGAQATIAEEITRLSKVKDEELKRLVDMGHVFGVFDD